MHFWKGAKFAVSVGHPMTKMLSSSGGLRPPDPLNTGSAPGPRWGLCPQTPVIGSCSALAMLPTTTDPFRRLCSAAYDPLKKNPVGAPGWTAAKLYARVWATFSHVIVAFHLP